MKQTRFRLFTIAAAVAALMLTSCAPVRDRRTLNDLESLMPEGPDSALAVLRGLQPRDLPGLHVRPLHALLLSEALDKNYIDLTDDSLALAANRYYGDHGTKLHRLKSWYYLGRIRFNSGNYAEAVICYDKALEYAEALTNYHYIGLVNREIANAYSEVWDDYHAIEYIRKSIDAFRQAEEQNYVDYDLLALARMLRSQEEYDECESVIDQLLESIDNEYLEACLNELKGLNSLSTGGTSIDEVKLYFNKARIGSVLEENSVRLSNLAYVQELSGQSDSSQYYINKAVSHISSLADSIYVLYSQSRIAEASGDLEEANILYKSYASLQTPAIYRVLEQSVSFYQGNYYQNESRMNAMKARMRALSYGFMIILLTILAVHLLYRNRKQRAMIVEEMVKTSEIKQDLFALKNEKQEMGNIIAALFESRLNILQTLSEQYDLVDESHQRKMREKGRELSREEIVSSFRDKMRELRKDKEISLSMEEALNVWKDSIMNRFRSVFGEGSSSNPKMSKEDFEMAPYYFSGMKQKTISYLTGYSENAIKERKYRIKHKIENLDNSFSKDKELFLSNLK
ncbi:MAG: tetratricopeptide repeat protein [Bacteroidales bacterium]|nr:tetratricopeptide repeat protein [Bacteroidales bacterium]